MTLNRFTIHLLHDVNEPDDALDPDRPHQVLELPQGSGLSGRFYYSARPARPPAWVTFMDSVTGVRPPELVSSSASGVLVVENSGRFFALTFGYGRGLLDASKVQQGFGLRVALNRIDARQLRSLDTKTFEDIVVSTSIQSSKSAQLPTFGVDVSRDILRAATGEPTDDRLGKRVSGSDAIVLNIQIDAQHLPDLLTELLTAYQEDSYKSDFGWIDDLTQVREKRLVDLLDEQLATQLSVGDTTTTHLAMPDVVDWEDVDAFRITGTRGATYEDLDLDLYLDTLATTADITTQLLRSRNVHVRYTRSPHDWAKGWTLYQCLVSEQRFDGNLYVLINGSWFRVAETLVEQVDEYTTSIPVCSMMLPNSKQGESEREYNVTLASASDDLLLLDAKIRRPGGAASGIEMCDLLSKSGRIIHVKRKARSATLSHLFAQGSVSARTFLEDGAFRDGVRDAIEKLALVDEHDWLEVIPARGATPTAADYTVAYLVIAPSSKSGTDWLPFFSKLNLMQHAREIRRMGFGVELARVSVSS
ncbi:DUF6119 family protein [Microbacterium aurantiacum]|uniref:TIGR04141 family sporadically distributed protein n=1 Tax=Microbacterium aurantiacum TaxID=162393 RepID=A0ABT8FWP5_9MICO|nr:DUF6119 family protein [Microbacterium aurantiacum]MDN4465729.1 TIGR04141 family sporadically distributed protein [Microbacterium aurantiacum]